MVKKELPSLIRFALLMLLLVAARFATSHIEGSGATLYNLDDGTESTITNRSAVVQATR